MIGAIEPSYDLADEQFQPQFQPQYQQVELNPYASSNGSSISSK